MSSVVEKSVPLLSSQDLGVQRKRVSQKGGCWRWLKLPYKTKGHTNHLRGFSGRYFQIRITMKLEDWLQRQIPSSDTHWGEADREAAAGTFSHLTFKKLEWNINCCGKNQSWSTISGAFSLHGLHAWHDDWKVLWWWKCGVPHPYSPWFLAVFITAWHCSCSFYLRKKGAAFFLLIKLLTCPKWQLNFTWLTSRHA